MATKKLTEPQEVCPVCGRKFEFYGFGGYWECNDENVNHAFIGPNSDQYGRGIDRMVRRIRRRMTKEGK